MAGNRRREKVGGQSAPLDRSTYHISSCYDNFQFLWQIFAVFAQDNPVLNPSSSIWFT
jgi:hypothetical protein